MEKSPIVALIGLVMLASPGAQAQTTDTAAERARLANERIRLEAERRAEEEARRREREEAVKATAPADPPAPLPEPPSKARATPAPRAAVREADPERISRALEQLRDLGELRDAGYVTEEEFERIKARILESRF